MTLADAEGTADSAAEGAADADAEGADDATAEADADADALAVGSAAMGAGDSCRLSTIHPTLPMTSAATTTTAMMR